MEDSPGHKRQPDIEGIETTTLLSGMGCVPRSQTPARHRGHRNGSLLVIVGDLDVRHKPQPDIEGIETLNEVIMRANYAPSQTPARHRGHRNLILSVCRLETRGRLLCPRHENRASQTPARHRGHRNKRQDQEHCADSDKSQTSARHRGHRNVTSKNASASNTPCHKPQPDIEGIEHEVCEWVAPRLNARVTTLGPTSRA